MAPKKITQLATLNSLIVAADVSVFSKAFLGFSLFSGTAMTMSVGWFTLLASIASFSYFNKQILTSKSTYMLMAEKVKSLDGLFNVVDVVTDKVGMFTDTVSSAVIGLISKILKFKKNEEDEE